MTTVRVWAPNARTVDLAIGGERLGVRGDERGWWSVEVPAAGAGTKTGDNR